MKFAKLYDVKSPNRGTPFSAGIDFYVPKFTEQFINNFNGKNPQITLDLEKKLFYLGPHERVLIPSGIKVEFDSNHMLTAYNKSGVASKKGLDLLASVVDEDYQGEVHISVVNTSNEVITINEDEKIIQFILIPVSYAIPEEVLLKDLYTKTTERGAGGFGSTNHK